MYFSEIKSKEAEVIEVPFQDGVIKIKTYLPIEAKEDLVSVTLQKAYEASGIYNPLKVEKYYNVNVLYAYTDLIFTEEERANPQDIYDICEQNGVFDLVFANIPAVESRVLQDSLVETERKLNRLNTSAAGAFNLLLNSFSVEELKKKLKDFNVNDYEEVVNFANAIGADIPQ